MDITDFIRFVIEAVIAGARGVARVSQRVAKRYLVYLAWTSLALVGSTLIWGAIGIWAGSRGLTAFAGLWGLLAFGVLSLIGAPVGVLVSIALPMGTAPAPTPTTALPPWYTWFNPFRIGRELQNYKRGFEKRVRDGVERYFKTARLVLACTGFFFGFSALLPISGNRDSMMVITVLAISIGFSLAHDAVWMKWLRGCAVAGIVLTIPGMIFPRVSWIGLLFPTPSAEALTNKGIETGTSRWWNWFNQSYNQPAMFVLYILAGIAITLLCMWWYRRTPSATTSTTASGGGDANAPAHAGGHDAHDAHAGFSLSEWLKKNAAAVWVFVGLTLIVALVVFIMSKVHENGVGTQTAIDTAAEQRARVLIASAMIIPTWHNLMGATEYQLTLATNAIQVVPKPPGMSVRWEPEDIEGLEVFWNGANRLSFVPGSVVKAPQNVSSYGFRLSGTNGITTASFKVAVGAKK